MQISKISPRVAFSGSIQRTEKGNEYEKTNVAKGWLTSLAGAGAILNLALDNKAPKEKLTQAGFSLAIFLALGSIIDHWANKQRRKDADSFAETKQVPELTNRGKLTGAKIGLGIGTVAAAAIYAILSVKKKAFSTAEKILPLVVIPMATLANTFYGWFYDIGVNRFRKQLKNNVPDKNEPFSQNTPN